MGLQDVSERRVKGKGQLVWEIRCIYSRSWTSSRASPAGMELGFPPEAEVVWVQNLIIRFPLEGGPPPSTAEREDGEEQGWMQGSKLGDCCCQKQG